MTGRRKRPHVPETSRKRVARACGTCRRLKEKCEGGFPCTRCKRLHQICEVTATIETSNTHSLSSQRQAVDDDFYDKARIEGLESIVKHYTGLESLDTFTITSTTESIRSHHEPPIPTNSDGEDGDRDEDFTVQPVSSTTAVYDAGLSLCEFSTHVQRRLNEDLQGPNRQSAVQPVPKDGDLNRASKFHTRASVASNVMNAFPPLEVAEFLLSIYFEYGQTNYFYVDEPSMREKVGVFYSGNKNLRSEDASWLCTMLMVFAMGTQFAHLSSGKADRVSGDLTNGTSEMGPSPDDEAASRFYYAAITLIPEVISLASLESVQAFLLLGTYTLLIDAGGLSFTYFGIALRIAIQNGMHRKLYRGMDARTIEIRNRVWWTTYALEKRICVMHGRPVSLAGVEMDAALPSHFPSLNAENRIDTLPNILTMIKLTTILEDARSVLYHIRRSSKRASATNFDPVVRVQQDLHNYWQQLPTTVHCRDLNPSGPLFRFNVHLALIYHVIRVFIGRNFIFTSGHVSNSKTRGANDAKKRQEQRDSLTTNCVKSATDIIMLCQMLYDELGLARASYTEFTSCRAAILVILAQRIVEPNVRLRIVSQQGIKLLRNMALGLYSADAEKSSLEAMEVALQRLDSSGQIPQSVKANADTTAESAYERFRNWAVLWKAKDTVDITTVLSQMPAGVNPDSSFSNHPMPSATLSPLPDFGWDMYSPSFLFEMGDGVSFDDAGMR